MIFEYSAGQLNHVAPFSRPIFDRVIYSVFCDVHDCKLFIAWLQWLIQLPSSVENRTREAQTKRKAVNDISEEKRYIAVYKCKPHRWIDDKNRCLLLSLSIFRQIPCFSRVSYSRETGKQLIRPGGFPVVGFLLTPYFAPTQVGTSTTTSEYLCMGEVWWSLYNKKPGN